MRAYALSVLFAVLTTAAPAVADDAARDFCADRPGNGTPTCVLDQGRVQLEMGVADASFSHSAGVHEDSLSLGATEMRAGLTGTMEAQLSWAPYTSIHDHDTATGARSHADGIGDVTLALRQSLRNPDGSGFSVALQPFVTAPTGDKDIGASEWQGGLILPLSLELESGLSLSVSPEIDVLPGADGHGSHAGWGGAAGVSAEIGTVTTGAEIWLGVDDDPAGRQTQASFDLTAAWAPEALYDFQIDVGLNLGLTHDTPGIEIAAGIARRF